MSSPYPQPSYIRDPFEKYSIPTGAQNVSLATAGTTSFLSSHAVLYIGSSGTIVVNLSDGSAGVTFSSVQIGFFPVLVTGIISSGTTAANIVALY